MISRHATLDDDTIKLMKKLKIKPKICKYCHGKYYPYRTDTKKAWEESEYCSSICKANGNLKPFKRTLI